MFGLTRSTLHHRPNTVRNGRPSIFAAGSREISVRHAPLDTVKHFHNCSHTDLGPGLSNDSHFLEWVQRVLGLFDFP